MMNSCTLPWAILSAYDKDGKSNLVQLHEPYTESVQLASRPACVTFFDHEQPQPYGPGLYTSLRDSGDKQIMCNFLQLSLTPSPKSTSMCAKQSLPLSSEITTNVFLQLCLHFSDIICINAQTEWEIFPKVLSVIDNLESGRIHTEPQLIILLGNTASESERDEMDVKRDLGARTAKERGNSQWAPRVLQNLTVQHYDPRRTEFSALLMSIRGYIAKMQKKRIDRNHLWTIAEIDYLIGQYLSFETRFVACHQRLARSDAPWRDATWYPVALRRRFWPGESMQKQNSLTKWFQTANQQIDLNVDLAPIFARMFLEDGDLLMHGRSYPVDKFECELIGRAVTCRIPPHRAF